MSLLLVPDRAMVDVGPDLERVCGFDGAECPCAVPCRTGRTCIREEALELDYEAR